MFVPEGYASLGDAIECVARIREPEAAAALTPEATAFFARLGAALDRLSAPPPVPLPVPAVVTGNGGLRPSSSRLLDLCAADAESARTAEAPPEGPPVTWETGKRWSDARLKLAAARNKARADLRQALISGTVRAAAVREDGNLVTLNAADWRRPFRRRHEQGTFYKNTRNWQPFEDASEGRPVPVAATQNGNPTAWGHPIIARADLARWCGAPPEAEPAERPAGWPALAPSAPPSPMLPEGAWWTAEQALSWLAFRLPLRWEEARQAAGAPDDDGERMARAQRQISEAIAARSLQAWGQETADIAKPPLGDTLVPIPQEDFAGSSALTVQMNGWAFPPAIGRRHEGRWWQGIRFEAAEVRRAFPGTDDCQAPEPEKGPAATPSAPEPAGQPAPVYSKAALRYWYRLRVSTWPASHPPPSEADDIAAAAAHFRRDIPRDPFREIRRELAPEAWKKPGPRSKRA